MTSFRRITLILRFVLAAWLITASQAQLPLSGAYGIHDPSTIHKSAGSYFCFGTGAGIPGLSSTDLKQWNPAGTVFTSPPAWTHAAVSGFDGNFWAPDLAYFNGKYHLYYSISRWGTKDSAIGLATSPTLVNPVWTDQGKVVQSDEAAEAGPDTDYTTYNCIDPAVFVDANGRVWMAFGSYFSGIAIREINPATGKPLNGTTTLIASNAIGGSGAKQEAASIFKYGDHYYLLVNFGQCCAGVESTYHIRVGRSLGITGPYLDRNGGSMTSGGGTTILESTGRYIGPGHPGIFADNNRWWLGHHYYDGNVFGAARLGIREVTWNVDGWPVVSGGWQASYPFDIDGSDQQGAFPADLTGGAAITVDPERGKVLDLPGNGARAGFPIPVGKARSFSAWVKWNGGPAWQRVFDFGRDTGTYAMLTPMNHNGKLEFSINNDGTQESLVAAAALPAGSWHHVAVTIPMTGDSILYLDGRPVASAELSIAPWELLASNLYLGKSQFAADPSFSGKIDDFRVFGRALSGGEVARMAGTGIGGRSAVAYWNFEEGLADTQVPYSPASPGLQDGAIKDVSANGHPLSAWSSGWAWYRNTVPAPVTPATETPNTLCVRNSNNFPSLSSIGTGLTDWTPQRWTIEAAIRPDAVSSYQTIVGRDSRGAHAADPRLAALYFSVRPGGVLAIQFTDAAGDNWNLTSAANAISAQAWQAVAATSDGKLLRLYRRNLSNAEPAYTLLASLDISSSSNPAIHPGTGDGTDWDRGVITVGRGLWDGAHADRFLGMLDDIRLSESALGPGEFLYRPSPTIAHWNFEEGSADAYVPYSPPAPGAFDGSLSDVSGNGNPLSAWSGQWAWYRSEVPLPVTPLSGNDNRLSVRNTGAFPSLSAIGTSLTQWCPAEWTLEAAIRPDATTGYQTFIGRDNFGANEANPAASALYFSLRPGGVLAIHFTDRAGNDWNLESAAGAITAGQWHAVAATSDGMTLKLYRRNIGTAENSFALLGTLDISGSTDPALHPGAGDGPDWDRGVISVARGLYNGTHTDRFLGNLDDIRLSSAALDPSRFLYVPQPQTPSNLTATSGVSGINLSWSPVADATGYHVKRSINLTGPYALIASGLVTNGYFDSGHAPGSTFSYVVTSVRNGVESLPSAPITASIFTASENWRLANFGSTSNTGNAADTEDPDKDGLNNLLEYALGSNPNGNSATAAPQVSTTTGKLKIAFTRNTAASDLTLSVIAADSLTGPWTGIARSTNGAAFTAIAPGALVSETGAGSVRNVESTDIVLITDPAHPKRFMRLKVER